MIELNELMRILGYGDARSVHKWCQARSIPIVKLGLKKYILSHYLTQHIDNQLVIFVKGITAPTSQNDNTEARANTSDSKNKKRQTGSANNLYQPNDEIITKYLNKYESINKPQTPKKR